MTASRSISEEEKEITHAVGDCILAWAMVELRIAFILQHCLTHETHPGIAIWDMIQSFRGKLGVLRVALLEKHKAPPLSDEIRLLLKRAETLYSKRSAVAHSTLIYEDEKRFVIEPFWSFSGSKQKITLQELLQYRSDFGELTKSLHWLLVRLTMLDGVPGMPPPQTEPRPDLVQRLLDEEDQNRQVLEQQQQDRDLVKRLRKEGKWPPA